MIKKTIAYTDFDGNPAAEDMWFHIAKSDILDNLTMKYQLENIEQMLSGPKRELKPEEVQELVNLVKYFMKLGYGIRTEDGKRFRKSDEIWDDFISTAAYDDFIFSLFREPVKAFEFIQALLPQDMLEFAKQEMAKQEEAKQTATEAVVKSLPTTPVDEVKHMTREDLEAALARMKAQ